MHEQSTTPHVNSPSTASLLGHTACTDDSAECRENFSCTTPEDCRPPG